MLTIISNSSNNSPIGFFDSGVGGLTVLKQFRNILPNEDCLYFGDTKNMPYGEKTDTELVEFADKIFNFFEKKGVKAVIMACNTTSAITYERLKNNYNFKIYPIIQSVTKILSALPVKKIGIMATNATINSRAYSQGIHKFNPEMKVVEIACPGWVKIVENRLELAADSHKELKNKLNEMLVHNPEKIVLACTHYPYLLPQLSMYADKDLFIDPAVYFAQYIKEDLKKSGQLNNSNKKGTEKFFVSASPENFEKASSIFYNISSKPELVNLNTLGMLQLQ